MKPYRISFRYRYSRAETMVVLIDEPAPDGMVEVVSWTQANRVPVKGFAAKSEIFKFSWPVSLSDYPGKGIGLSNDLDLPWPLQNRKDWLESTLEIEEGEEQWFS